MAKKVIEFYSLYIIHPKPFLELQASYASLTKDLDKGVISSDSFTKAMKIFRLQDEQDTWWQLGNDGQSWLRWDGSSWVSDQPGQKK